MYAFIHITTHTYIHTFIHTAGTLLVKHGMQFDVVYTSWLSRAIETAWLVLNEMDLLWLPISKSWRLNERSNAYRHAYNKTTTDKCMCYHMCQKCTAPWPDCPSQWLRSFTATSSSSSGDARTSPGRRPPPPSRPYILETRSAIVVTHIHTYIHTYIHMNIPNSISKCIQYKLTYI